MNTVYSAQRFQPYRGGHAVPVAAGTPAGGPRRRRRSMPATATPSRSRRRRGIPTCWGPRGSTTPAPGTNPTPYYSTNPIYHTLGIANDQAESWDYFPFHDRDFTGVAELMLVPGCPPGLFTKQFAEFAPSRSSSGIFAQVQPQPAPPPIIMPFATAATAFVTGSAANPMPAHTFPYLVDKFFYTGASSAADTGGTLVGGPTGDGWFKMFDFFEVPSPTMGATGPVAQGTNFDWERQDIRPGLLNLNLIIDEEVFFSVVGRQDANFNQQWLNFIQVPSIPARDYSLPLNGKTADPAVRPAGAAGGHRDRRERIAGLCLSDHQPGRHGHGSDPRRARPGQSVRARPDRGQPDQGGLRPVPLAAARRLGLPLRVRERGRRAERRGGADRPGEPGARRIRLGHPGRAAVPLAVVPRHRLHGDAPGDAPAVAIHQSAEHGPRPRTRPIRA